MTLSDRIRRAALGPTPRHDADLTAAWISLWIPFCDNQPEPNFSTGSDTERRMFLLFVAEALDDVL